MLSGHHISWLLFQGKETSIPVLLSHRFDPTEHLQRRAMTSSKGDRALSTVEKALSSQHMGHPMYPNFVRCGRGRNITMVTQQLDLRISWSHSFATGCGGNPAGPYPNVVLLQGHYLCYDFLLSPPSTHLKTIHLMKQDIPTDRVHLIQVLLGLPYPL